MVDPKTAGAYLAGRTMGKMAGRVEANNAAGETIDIQHMAIEKLRHRVSDERALMIGAMVGRGVEIAHVKRFATALQAIQKESRLIAAHLAQHGSVTDTEFRALAPVTVERQQEERADRPITNRISKAAVFEYLASEDGQTYIFGGYAFTPEERAQILNRIHADVEKIFE